MHRLRNSSAALLLAVVAAVSALPFAAAGETPGGCHCVVRMECCEDGTCTMGAYEPPAAGPEWRTCRREQAATTTPVDAFERALMSETDDSASRPTGQIVAHSPRLKHFAATDPSTPPPRFPF
jgi:hypothetical protein